MSFYSYLSWHPTVPAVQTLRSTLPLNWIKSPPQKTSSASRTLESIPICCWRPTTSLRIKRCTKPEEELARANVERSIEKAKCDKGSVTRNSECRSGHHCSHLQLVTRLWPTHPNMLGQTCTAPPPSPKPRPNQRAMGWVLSSSTHDCRADRGSNSTIKNNVEQWTTRLLLNTNNTKEVILAWRRRGDILGSGVCDQGTSATPELNLM